MTAPWKPVSPWVFGAATAGLALLIYLRVTSTDGYIRILDDANLVFHEAGHPIFGVLGQTLGLYGGTLGQLVFPAAVCVTYWKRREAAAFFTGLVWLFENFLNISRYMADARAQILPLVGGGEHDWTSIFTRWGILQADTTFAGYVKHMAWLGILGSWCWLAWLSGSIKDRINWNRSNQCRGGF